MKYNYQIIRSTPTGFCVNEMSYYKNKQSLDKDVLLHRYSSTDRTYSRSPASNAAFIVLSEHTRSA